MAKIQEEVLVIRVSQLVREGAESKPRVTEDVTQALVQVAEELVGAGAVVEIERA
jgi:hypothetical protein